MSLRRSGAASAGSHAAHASPLTGSAQPGAGQQVYSPLPPLCSATCYQGYGHGLALAVRARLGYD